ncbi:uncharacterized protein BO97DRAFT_336129 [Aspergillus homomorphus CBS 101889]|uniref:Restriction endonuclease n=1 Tax=Aspergillus homomorphus (strain CBS 101889) TaxID=1450537 RepID=A0A395I8U6_ASPHC|nr:hypothetical protein BO97DRAFT_336129 [Aspergillus homomorphus CBS 101889]RAL16587.1 hypothetical protein BO97DRAFT_336129 [Aspergillus homomorphus CBS 101889]
MAAQNQVRWIIPSTANEWDTLAVAYGVTTRSLKSCKNLVSGSRVTREQYLLFRTLYPDPSTFFTPALYGLTADMQTARGMLTACPQFQAYLNAIPNHQWNDPQIGRFFNTLHHQWLVAAAGTPGCEAWPAVDEAMVNPPLIEFLNALSVLRTDQRRCWTLRHSVLRAQFYGRERSYVACTDGQLIDYPTQELKALVECKKSDRDSSSGRRTVMQEIAELVAWIKACPDPRAPASNHLRALISQDRTRLFISFLSYSPEWASYIKGGSIANAGLATYQTFGPWNTQDPADVLEFAVIALAIMLHS